MGGTGSKQEFRTAVLDLVNSKQVETKFSKKTQQYEHNLICTNYVQLALDMYVYYYVHTCLIKGYEHCYESTYTSLLCTIIVHVRMQSVTGLDNSYWDRFWSDPTLTPMDYFSLVTFQDIRDLRDKASGNLTALCFKVSLSLPPPPPPLFVSLSLLPSLSLIFTKLPHPLAPLPILLTDITNGLGMRLFTYM